MRSKILSKISNQENVGKILLDLNFKHLIDLDKI